MLSVSAINDSFRTGYRNRQNELGLAEWEHIPSTDPVLYKLSETLKADFNSIRDSNSQKSNTVVVEKNAEINSGDGSKDIIAVIGETCSSCNNQLTKFPGRGRNPSKCLNCRGLI